MATILHIDTAGTTACVMLAAGGKVLSSVQNEQVTTHATFLHPAIQHVLDKAGITLKETDAVAVANGPGSYTGLRVGLAAAKGICYALNKPLICINNLNILAVAALLQNNAADLCIPMIDARRMEVFTAVYKKDGKEILAPHAKILDQNSFIEQLQDHKILFCGDAIPKWQKLTTHPNALFSTGYDVSTAFAQLAHDSFITNQFADLAYAEPFYIKEFYFGNS